MYATASSLIALKFYQPCPEDLWDMVDMCDRTFSLRRFAAAELKVLTAIRWNLNLPTAYSFLRNFCIVGDVNLPGYIRCKYISELFLQDSSCLSYNPSTIAAAAVFIVRKMNGEDPWNSNLACFTRHSAERVNSCSEKLALVLKEESKKYFENVRLIKSVTEKYAVKKFFYASHYVLEYVLKLTK